MTTSVALSSPSLIQSLYWSNLDKMNMATADRDAAKAQVVAVAAVQDAFDAAVMSVNTNGDLSAQGRASALLGASKRSLDQLDTLTAPTLAALDAQIVGHARALTRAAAGPDASAVTESRAKEARAAFRQIDPLLAPSRYLALVESGQDDAACVAIENAPFEPLLPASVIEQGKAIRGARALPDQAASLETASDLRSLLAASVAAARRHMCLGVAGGDPLQVANMTVAEVDDDNGEV